MCGDGGNKWLIELVFFINIVFLKLLLGHILICRVSLTWYVNRCLECSIAPINTYFTAVDH